MSSEYSDPTGRDVLMTFVAAYPAYVVGRLEALGIAGPAGMPQAIEQGQRALHEDLGALLAQPLQGQDRSPLEVFQGALEGPTEVLVAAGTTPVQRDPVAANALPGDIYDLAPASSQALGDAAFEAHVAWGIAKAGAVAGVVPAATGSREVAVPAPAVVLVGSDPADRGTFEAAAATRGLAVVRWRNPGAIEQGLLSVVPLVAFVDVAHGAADAAIRLLTAAGVRTVAFGSGVDDFALARFGVLGAEAVLERDRLFSRLADFLPQPA